MIVLEYGVERRNVTCIYYSQRLKRIFGLLVQATMWHPFKEYKKSIQVHAYLLTNFWDLRQKKLSKGPSFGFKRLKENAIFL